jgi:hypothetical protein
MPEGWGGWAGPFLPTRAPPGRTRGGLQPGGVGWGGGWGSVEMEAGVAGVGRLMCQDLSLCRLPALSADPSRHSMWRIGRLLTHSGGLTRWTGRPGPRHLTRTHEDP